MSQQWSNSSAVFHIARSHCEAKSISKLSTLAHISHYKMCFLIVSLQCKSHYHCCEITVVLQRIVCYLAVKLIGHCCVITNFVLTAIDKYDFILVCKTLCVFHEIYALSVSPSNILLSGFIILWSMWCMEI